MENKIIKIILGTSNPNKVREMNAIAKDFSVELMLPNCEFNPVENGATFEENARIKALEISGLSSGDYFMADDSGLCVDYLKGAPGIHSARYAETQEKRIDKLLSALKGVNKRHARFVCALCLVNKKGEIIHETKGYIEGEITLERSGNNGFGYDPIFLVKGLNKTMAELSEEEKNTLSHRGQALNNMLKWVTMR
ncbi:MAG: RdgB/HAM1 family non-canonical purine NTP pyrophosphatase [Candidatus Gastranaerophilales bacterium]|nr:RdgB/HAM1 family non-canonical purine NTP pyrophosphatase [Candidatus Gastranaerophilales bacterium]